MPLPISEVLTIAGENRPAAGLHGAAVRLT